MSCKHLRQGWADADGPYWLPCAFTGCPEAAGGFGRYLHVPSPSPRGRIWERRFEKQGFIVDGEPGSVWIELTPEKPGGVNEK